MTAITTFWQAVINKVYAYMGINNSHITDMFLLQQVYDHYVHWYMAGIWAKEKKEKGKHTQDELKKCIQGFLQRVSSVFSDFDFLLGKADENQIVDSFVRNRQNLPKITIFRRDTLLSWGTSNLTRTMNSARSTMRTWSSASPIALTQPTRLFVAWMMSWRKARKEILKSAAGFEPHPRTVPLRSSSSPQPPLGFQSTSMTENGSTTFCPLRSLMWPIMRQLPLFLPRIYHSLPNKQTMNVFPARNSTRSTRTKQPRNMTWATLNVARTTRERKIPQAMIRMMKITEEVLT